MRRGQLHSWNMWTLMTLHAHGLWDQDRSPLIQTAPTASSGRRARVLEHLIADAKLELIKLFYGACPTMELPWILVLSSEWTRPFCCSLARSSQGTAPCTRTALAPFSAGLRHPLAHREQSSNGAVRQGSGSGEHQRDPHLRRSPFQSSRFFR